MTKELPWYYIYSSNALTRLHFGPFTKVFFIIVFVLFSSGLLCNLDIGAASTYRHAHNVQIYTKLAE
jgi:hypothetical protein